MERETYAAPDELDLGRTMRALGCAQFDGHSWWWATHTHSGLATVELTATDAAITATTWGDGAVELLARTPRLVGLDDETCVAEGDLPRPLRDAVVGLRLGSTSDVHGALVKAVLGQVVTTKEAKASLRELTASLGEQAPGPNGDLRARPSPECLAKATYDELHRYGIERKRATVLIEVSRRSTRMDEITTMDRGTAYRRLEAVRGIGPWTSAMVMGTAWGDRDAVPVGDYHLPNSVAWALAGEPRGTDERMLELLEPYRPQRRRVIVAIKQAGVHAPRFGPKTAIRRHL